jgi:hypothetical protein
MPTQRKHIQKEAKIEENKIEELPWIHLYNSIEEVPKTVFDLQITGEVILVRFEKGFVALYSIPKIELIHTKSN